MRLWTSPAFGRLLVLLASVVLLTSRAMLLLHEFVGHGAVATVLGGQVTGWRLFLFAGGRVSFRTEGLGLDSRLLISLGGIALELALGTIAIALARRMRERHVVAFSLWCAGGVVVAHAAVYLARGVHYGFGDGALLAARLGGLRGLIVLAASVLAIATALFAARRLAALPLSIFAGSRGAVIGATLLVFAGAAVIHGALAWVEIRYFPDPTWAAIMEDASVAKARADLARELAEPRRRGESLPSTGEQQRMLDELERARRPWPLDPVLIAGLVAAIVAGVVRGARADHPTSATTARASPPSWRAIGIVAALLVVALGVIFALRSQTQTQKREVRLPANPALHSVARALDARPAATSSRLRWRASRDRPSSSRPALASGRSRSAQTPS